MPTDLVRLLAETTAYLVGLLVLLGFMAWEERTIAVTLFSAACGTMAAGLATMFVVNAKPRERICPANRTTLSLRIRTRG